MRPALTYTPPKYTAVLASAYSGGRKGNVSAISPELAAYGDEVGTMLTRLAEARKLVKGKNLTVDDFNTTTSMDAWDIERIGNVVRFSVASGYLSEDEGYEWLAVADRMTRERFSSWTQYAASFLVGRALCYDGEMADVALNAGSATRNEKSPWLTFPL
ncbi:DUF1266 domain-containing protein [Klugiella xanthotipulae]|uniref:DUF1266 domain-containing protein n=1 Tax=Klugiella xanthotipulae TaxID=244735 RepID=UPI001FE74A25|nr:DUF1266 domain-containing protein [Klugiella xanthotipulae]